MCFYKIFVLNPQIKVEIIFTFFPNYWNFSPISKVTCKVQSDSGILRLLVLFPNHPMMRYHLGITYYKNGEKENAKRELKKAIELDPEVLRS